MIIKSAEFVKSAVKPEDYPDSDLPEIAFAGRSNVGKSSLINKLLNRNNLVKTSRTPGRTQLLNFFDINDTLTFVDLPGYGYAKVPPSVSKNWGKMIETYLSKRKNLSCVVLIIDIRRNLQADEFNFIDWMRTNSLPHILAVTKADKFSKGKQKERITSITESLKTALIDNMPLIFSAKTGQGKDDLWKALLNTTLD